MHKYVCRYEGKEETLHYHSVPMAVHSNYFDTLLASGMEESETKKVTLDDVDPNLFRSAIEILEDPQNILTVSAEQMMTVAPLYNRFEFKNGLKLAETVLGKFMDKWTKQKGKSPNLSEQKLFGDSILFSQEANLENLTEKSISFIKEKFKRDAHIMELAIFDHAFIEKIAPFLEEHRVECLTDLFSRFYPDPDQFQERLASADLLEELRWRIVTRLGSLQMKPFGLKPKGSINLGGDRAPEVVNLGFCNTAAGHFRGGEEVHCLLSRITCETYRLKHGGNGVVGDWVAYLCVVGARKVYKFVWPNSKSLSLPPIGNQWALVTEDGEGNDSGPKATFELLSIKAS